MTHWPDRPICAFDLETTDRDPRIARIVTASVVVLDGDTVASRTWLLDPGIEIPEETSAIHGVTTERARAEGLEYTAGYAQIREALCEAWVRDHIVVAFNASYDLTVIDAEGRRLGLPGLATGLVFDPYVVDREMDRGREGGRTLQAVCAAYGVTLTAAHQAEADALAAGQLARALCTRFPQLADLDIMTDQAAWHAERQRNFAEYLSGLGRDASDVDPQWPIRGIA
ncbi:MULTISPECIES: 3'-5' exonuclease [Rhodococcus]|jgi:DNA polymerase-3 subunit epsilon|uniref:3'-5' exonuclease n=1 Tax=Rhodococcus aetherivorans TaxID=191292 RepID=A0A059MI82_9NOCA|nr:MULTISPECIES: 3'-5' exonuclease [Rhodococcus]ETT23607.1 Exonuclease RNase T and DNA polymerase III [Rhodococcus rhodochrous ATCC 21198]AKE91671.1 DNA polymerase III subunit epsilon [Rhodococcus aetherivorans]ANZ23488.1 DNA polymerase III subunit epsilon [Rhodococcus sp. WB1]KDE10732.1 DNA polymerase III subunit epsilon [Rhodococcus aetherivorans]MBC2589530.1 3'-5' exonuclease [Rhodococcus aetherivorans]